MKTVLLTGSQGFIGSYVATELLQNGYNVVGIDNHSKYGPDRTCNHEYHSNFKLYNRDIATTKLEDFIVEDIDYIIAGAAMIGGIGYFHKHSYDLISVNEKIMANTYDFAVKIRPQKVVVISSSMVYENYDALNLPLTEDVAFPPTPKSTYGFQKLACEFFAKGAKAQYGINYNIVRPFNCVGLGEDLPKAGNMREAMTHVLPDLVYKSLHLKSTDELPVLGTGTQTRHYTHGKDIALGIRLIMETTHHINEVFNISSDVSTSVDELAAKIWKKIHTTEPRLKHLPGYEHDVQRREPVTTKAENLLNFKATIPIDYAIDEVIAHQRKLYGKDV